MRALSLVALLIALFLPASAATVTFLGSDGLNDGAYVVGPYRLRINGIEYQAMCYDFDHHVSVNQTWQADLHEFSDLSAAYYGSTPGARSRYEMEAWLFSQIILASAPADRIAIQHAAWSLFSGKAPAQGAAAWLAAASANEAAGSPGLNLGTFRVVNSPAGANPQVQGFIVNGFPATPVPEPITLGLAGSALVALFLVRRYSAAVK